jgi:proteasome lid subunit RPN8/RPN11
VARQHGLGILCQVHSHPGKDTRHSDGDDGLVLLPFEGMLSVVVPDFGIGFKAVSQCGVHQFQKGRWVLCDPDSVARGVLIVPVEVDLRE